MHSGIFPRSDDNNDLVCIPNEWDVLLQKKCFKILDKGLTGQLIAPMLSTTDVTKHCSWLFIHLITFNFCNDPVCHDYFQKQENWNIQKLMNLSTLTQQLQTQSVESKCDASYCPIQRGRSGFCSRSFLWSFFSLYMCV